MYIDLQESAGGNHTIAFCSAAVGCGHGRASLAVRDAMRARGHLAEATFIDALEHAPRWFSCIYRDGYLQAVRHVPRAVGAMYDRSDIPRRDRRFLGPMLDKFEDRVLRNFRRHPGFARANAVVSTHFLTTAVLGRMRLRGELTCPLITIVTDEHPHAVWLHPGSDLTCVASATARNTAIAGGIHPLRVEVTGIPIDPRFCMAPPRILASESGGSEPVVVVSGGGCGLGNIPVVVKSILLAAPSARIVVVCGKNAQLEQRLQMIKGSLQPADERRLQVIGYTKEMHAIMSAADLLVGKPGGLTTTEARALGLPMVLLQPIPGQEERNASMLCELGAAVQANNAHDAGQQVSNILSNQQLHWRMRAAASSSGRPRAAFDAASRIAAMLSTKAMENGTDRLVGRPLA